ncbi:MAG: hypothetical protein IJV44_01745 [Prevotella sp.]|nr:hypothetical protein [Prevotella sp.]
MKETNICNIHPLTIITDRYSGCYSGGKYLAFNLEPWQVPKGVDGNDTECMDFWDDECKEYVIGKGVTIQEAVDDLKRKMDASVFAFNIDRYLFLDFDGVLNTGRYAKQMKLDGIDPFDEFGALFDPETIANLKHIVELTDCKIILSTTWRNEGIMRMRELWEHRNLPGEIYSMTPILLSTSYQDAVTGEMMGLPQCEAKALEINAWLYKNVGKEYRYAILDDEDLFFPKQQEHLVLTEEYDGLTERKAQRAIWILNN